VSDTTLTKTLIATHERLYPRLASLLKQVERVAGREPRMEVPAETARLSRDLVREAARLLGPDGRGLSVPQGASAGGSAPALDHARLAIALGQAVAGLEAFEAAHSGWSNDARCAVWRIDGPPQPVLRLLRPGSDANPVPSRNPESARLREKVYRLIMGRYAAGYDAGYRDATAGTPPRADYCERVWDAIANRMGGDEAARRSGKQAGDIYSNPPRQLVPEGAELSDPAERARQ